MTAPASPETLKVYLGLAPATATDDEAMTAACDAANQLVVRLRPEWTTDGNGTVLTEWPADAAQAAVVEAARLYGGRGSVQGVAAFTDVGVSFIARMDPRVRELLQLGEYQPSVVA